MRPSGARAEHPLTLPGDRPFVDAAGSCAGAWGRWAIGRKQSSNGAGMEIFASALRFDLRGAIRHLARIHADTPRASFERSAVRHHRSTIGTTRTRDGA